MKKYLLKKRIFSLFFLCACACTLANATAKIEGNVLYLYSSEDANFESITSVEGYDASVTITKIVLDGDFTSGWSSGWLLNSSSTEPTEITEIDMSKADMTGDAISWGFHNFNHLTTIVWPVAGKITVIPSYAFKNCAFESLTIPGYIETIKSHAFDEESTAMTLKTIIFEEYDADGNGESDVNMTIETQAFSNHYALSDVFINTTGTIKADNNAFPHAKTYGHADVNRVLATLHFPAEKAEDYANLNHELDEETASDNKKFQEWLVEHYSLANAEGVKNGFYEFVSNGITDTEGTSWGDEFLRTYSHPTLSQIVPNGVKAYIVNGIETDNDSKIVTITLKKVNVIPAATGVILFGGTNSVNEEGEKVLSMMIVNYTGSAFDRDNTSNKNYLKATANADQSTIHVKPYEKDNDGNIIRNFLMGKFSSTDTGKAYYKENSNYGTGEGLEKGNWVGFFRAKEGDIAYSIPGKAYLPLKGEEYPFPQGGEVIINVTNQTDENNDTEYYRIEYKNKDLGKLTEEEMKSEGYWYKQNGDDATMITWAGNWGTRKPKDDFTMAKYNGELEDEEWMESISETTAISSVEVNTVNSDNIYTIQGVKVAQPTKGVYIKNGKKYIVK